MIPGPWVGVVLALAAFRIVRLIGWDDLPPIVRARWWAVGGKVKRAGSTNSQFDLTGEQPDEVVAYARPLLEHFLRCAYCQGFWVSLVVYLCWLGEPSWTVYGAAPFALSAAVGITARNLDP